MQRQLGRMLRSKVAGEDAPARAQRIWGAQGERWFTPEDPVWRVHADASMFPAGITSLLVYLALHYLFVRPMRRLTANLVGFHENPESAARIIVPSQRGDEVQPVAAPSASLPKTILIKPDHDSWPVSLSSRA